LGVTRKFAASRGILRNGDRCPLICRKRDGLCVTFASELKNDTGNVVLRVRRQAACNFESLIQ
jgi:hypothetical protein